MMPMTVGECVAFILAMAVIAGVVAYAVMFGATW